MSATTGASVNSVAAAPSSPTLSDCVRLVAVGASLTALMVTVPVPIGLEPCGPLAPSSMVMPTSVMPLKSGAESNATPASAVVTAAGVPVMV